MSDLINHLRGNKPALRKSRHMSRRLREHYNTLYFPNNIDVRLCPKVGCSSLKVLLGYINRDDAQPVAEFAQDYIKGNAARKRRFENLVDKNFISLDNNEFQFRHKSLKIAVVRDPVERALSAIKYSYRMSMQIREPSYKQIVDALDNMELRDNSHFFSQTFCMGRYDQYDKVYRLSDLDKLVDFLLKESSDFSQDYPFYKTNVSSTTFTVNDLPDYTVKRIESLYSIDYENGWFYDDYDD